MKRSNTPLIFLTVLYAFIFVVLSNAFAEPAKILKFEPADTLDGIRAKIKHNGYQFTVDHNWVYDMPREQKQRFLGRRAPASLEPPRVTKDIGPLGRKLGKALPSSFDWRNYNGHSYIGPIRNQGSCGSCYAFGVCAAGEGTYNWAHGQYDANCAHFSESYVIWCLGRLSKYNSHLFGS